MLNAKTYAHGDRILAKPISAEHKVGDLIIPDSSTNLKKGIVELKGDGLDGKPIPFDKGDVILYKADCGFEVVLEGVTYVVLLERDVWFYEKEN